MSTDSLGNVFLVGNTLGHVGGPNHGDNDGYVVKYDSAGNFKWATQIGSTALDWASGVIADGSGSAIITGRTLGVLGAAKIGSDDGYLGRIDSNGNVTSLTQFGTTKSEWGTDVARDAIGNIYVAGAAWGLFGPADIQDFFVAKFDPSGNAVWSHSFGTSGLDQVNSIATDANGNIYVVGVTEGKLGDTQFGSWDPFLLKFDSAGNLVWSKQFGSAAKEVAWAVTADQLGNVFVGGNISTPTTGTITHANMFLTKFDSEGNTQWTYSPSAVFYESIQGLTTDGLGNVYASGIRSFSNFSSYSSFVLKISEVPEPNPIPAIGLLSIVISFAVRIPK